jgi:hypothetical protein
MAHAMRIFFGRAIMPVMNHEVPDPDIPGRPELAAELLRRNPRFREDQARLAACVAAGRLTPEAAAAELRGRWGITFRG